MDISSVVIIAVAAALCFGVFNGFHDAANPIATIVSTRLMSPGRAVICAACFNFSALFLFHQGVATTISSLVEVNASDPAFVWVVLAGLVAATFWNLLTWRMGLPSSSSHAIVGGFAGAGFAYGGLRILNAPKLILLAEFIFVAPLLSFLMSSVSVLMLSWLFKNSTRQRVNRLFRGVRLLSAAAYSIGHGGNDAQKTMGIILAALSAGGYVAADGKTVPTWVAVSCYSAMAAGTALGGFRIIKTLGSRLTKLRSHEAFAAEMSGALTLFGATFASIPVSTTHTLTGAIIGVGSTGNARSIRWGLASNIVWAWVFTIPASVCTGMLCLKLFQLFRLF